MKQIVEQFDWRKDWMLLLIGFMFVLILFFEWRRRFSFSRQNENFINYKHFTIQEKTPSNIHQPTFLPWRDWKGPSSISTLVPSLSTPGGANLESTPLKGTRWGYAPPMNAVEAATPVEMTSNQPSDSQLDGNSGPMMVGMVSQLGTDVSNCEQDLFEESSTPRNVFSWQSGRTRVSLPLRTE